MTYWKDLNSQVWFYHAIPLLLWLGFVLLPFLFSPGTPMPGAKNSMMFYLFLGNLLLLFIFYIHSYYLYPILEIDRGRLWYFIAVAACLVAFLVASRYFRPEIRRFGNGPRFLDMTRRGPDSFSHVRQLYFQLVRFSIVMICSYCYCLFLDNVKRTQIIKEKENTDLKTELSFLRSQISPHFMFNVLNSMVSLARKKSDKLELSIINLSNLMRYMLYENSGNAVDLCTETEYLKNYIDLQLLRYGDSIRVNLYINGKLEGHRIEPMLLIPFVENAFKHGTSVIENPIIDISINIDENSTLEFIVMNSISTADDSDKKSSGIGLSNVRRRLVLLYPDSHFMRIEKANNIFKVKIHIKLDHEVSNS